ncbi:MAG: hypothetical protein OXR62_01850 [Ahrensia sp.]|nr:hypothetical protein [Ahrensia sp.]
MSIGPYAQLKRVEQLTRNSGQLELVEDISVVRRNKSNVAAQRWAYFAAALLVLFTIGYLLVL